MLIIVTMLYVLIQIVCIGTLPELATSSRPLADASNKFLGEFGGYLIAAGAVVSITGNLNGKFLHGPRVLFAMAEHRQMPRSLAAIHWRFQTPYISILVMAGVALGFALSGNFIQLVKISVLINVVTYGVTCAALPMLRNNRIVGQPAFKSPSGLLVATASVALCLWLLSNSTLREVMTAAIAGTFGLLLYFLGKMKRSDEQPDIVVSPDKVV